MRRFRDICLLLLVFGLGSSVRAQYYPVYPAPNYYPAYQNNPYGYYPVSQAPRYLPGYYAPAPGAISMPTPMMAPVQPGPGWQAPLPKSLPQPEAAPATPEPQVEPDAAAPDAPAEPAPQPYHTGLPPVRYTLPECLASFPYEAPRPCSYVWGKMEALLWQVRDGPPHYPLVTTDSNPGTLNSGSLSSPTARSLFGEDGFDYGIFHGGRLTVGMWLDSDQRLGIEGSGFLFETRADRFSADSSTYPALYLPAFSTTLGAESRLVVADPKLGLTGNVDIGSTLQLWGAEINGVYRLMRTGGWDVQLLGGFRYLDLFDSFELDNTTSGFGSSAFLLDRFEARNQFYGPQVGARVDYSYGPFTLGLCGKIALGVSHEVMEASGYNTSAATGSNLGGFFTQPTNIGRTTVDSFSAVPQFAMTIGYNLTDRIFVFAGYDFLLWTDVERSGSEIDRVLNLSQSAAFGTGTLSGAARPEPIIRQSDFWAQGISLGVQFRY